VRALRAAEERLEEALKSASAVPLSDPSAGGLAEGSRYRSVWLSPGVGRGMQPTPEWEERLLDRVFIAHYADARNPAGLSPGELEVFQLARGFEHREIGEKTGRTENQVRQLKHQAVKKVRKHGEIPGHVRVWGGFFKKFRRTS